MTAHSKLGASSMSRWSKCPGSVARSAGVESRSSSYAIEGTNAHALASVCLEKTHNPGYYLRNMPAGLTFDLTQEMADAVQVYLDEVRRHPGTLQIEQRFDLSGVHPGCFGTADAVIWDATTRLLTVIDFKYGAGVPVDVTDNPQLLYYGLGALLATKVPAKRVKLVIVQPRCDHRDGPVRSQEMDAIDLLDFRTDLKHYAAEAEKPDAPLVTGEHCRWCPAAPLCPALATKSQEMAKLEFSTSLSYDPAKLRIALDSLPVLEAWVKNVREFAYAEAESGRTPPGYKLVAKRATRKWRDENEVVEALQELGVKPIVFNEAPALKSPAQLEKVVDKGFLKQFVIAESSGHALAPESDKRPPIRLSSAQNDFDPVST